jgi:hypothetical protein
MKNSELLDKITKIVNRHDPLGLLASGAPKDEYSSEIGDIARLLYKERTERDKLGVKIHKIFIKSFGENIIGEKKKYEEIAKKILENEKL